MRDDSGQFGMSDDETLFRGAFEQAPFGMCLATLEGGRWTHVNPALCALLGYTEQQLLGVAFAELTHQDDIEHNLEGARRLREGEIAVYETDKRYLHADGHSIWVSLSASLLRDAQQAPRCVIVQVLDISARKAAEEALLTSERRLADAQALGGLGSWQWDLDSDAVTWSDQLCRIAGFVAGENPTTLDAFMALVHVEDRPRTAQTIDDTRHTGVSQSEYRLVRPDGDVRWVHGHRHAIYDAAGRPVRMSGTLQDVTDRVVSEHARRDAERALRQREGLLRSVIDNDKTLVYVKDLDGRYLLYNTRFAETFALAERAAAEGARADEVLLGRDDRWLDPLLAPVWRENDLRAQEGPHEIEEFSDDPSRGRLTYDSLKFPLLDDSGAVYATCGVSLETTERSREREQLAKAARYFEVSRDLTVTADFDGHFTSVNPALERILGWSQEEFMARPFIDMVHPDDRAATLREVGKLADGEVTFDFLNRYEAKDGSYRWLDWNAILSSDEELMYYAARDVTDRKRVEAALSASERQTHQILETAYDAFVAIDAGGLITDWNPQAEAMFGWSRGEALGRDLAETIIPAGQREAHRHGLQRFLAGGDSRILGNLLELSALHRDGHEFAVELTISAVESEHGYSFNAFMRDITERRRAQRELALARDQALEASRMKSMFVANVSHEIRTPMNGVIGIGELLLDTKLDDEQREYAEMICASGDALLEVIDDILDFSKIEAGKLELDPTDFDLRDAIEKACAMQAKHAHRKGVELVAVIDAELPELVHGDGARLRQVITNLVSNAVKFTAEGEIVLRASSAPGRDGCAVLRVEVSDTGIGIETEALEQLFQPFSQADSSTTRRFGGTGLGLAISRQLIELMGGTVGAQSEPGKGSSFWFQVPLARPAAGEVAPFEDCQLAGLRVLVVDDNAASRESLERQLGAWQMSCGVAATACEALELMESAAGAGLPYALALLDRNMPGADGYELACAIRAQPALCATRLVLLSVPAGRPEAFDDPDLFDGLLTKPVRQSRLHEELLALVAREPRPDRRIQTPQSPVAGATPTDASPEILVVEDTPVNQVVAVRMLQKCGFRVRVAENGREALVALSERDYAAVLMDCQMPELDGYETTKVIRGSEQDGDHTPVIAMTANSMRGERERCLAAGMDDYLTKPLRNRMLMDALKRWITDAPAPAPTAASPVAGGARGAAGRSALLDEEVIAELGFDGEGLTELHSMYFDQAAAQVSQLGGAIARRETIAVAKTAHQLKGSSATIGAARVSQLACELEMTARNDRLAAAPALLDLLRRSLAETRTALARAG